MRLRALLLLMLVSGGAAAWEPEIVCHSGSPLLLEIRVEEPEAGLSSVVLEAEGSLHRFELSGEGEPIELRVSPFLEAGTYELDLRFLRGTEVVLRRSYEIGFVDFVFGRDNFRFGNNADYESLIGTYSEILTSWLTERFEEPGEAEIVLLTDYMYSLFGSNPGRCYAFSGTQLRYWRNGDLLPSYYDSAYDIPQRVRRQQREMNYLQLDVVYDTFVAPAYGEGRGLPGGGPGREAGATGREAGTAGREAGTTARDSSAAVEAVSSDAPRSRESLSREVDRVIHRISGGEPAAVGFIGPELHHSMLVYGFIREREKASVDLLVANNWKSEENLNLRSRDAETVRVDLREEAEGGRLRWSDVNGPRERQPDRLFLVDIEEEYTHAPGPMERLLRRRTAELRDAGHALVVVENAQEAWLTDSEERVTGYKQRRNREEIEGIRFDRVKRNYRFEYPEDSSLWLEFTDDQGARVLHFSGEEGSIIGTSVPDDEKVQRRLLLAPDARLPGTRSGEEDREGGPMDALDRREETFR